MTEEMLQLWIQRLRNELAVLRQQVQPEYIWSIAEKLGDDPGSLTRIDLAEIENEITCLYMCKTLTKERT